MADVEQDLEKIAEKEKLEELENEVKELRNRSRRNNLVYSHVPEKAEGQECADFVQDFIATHMGLETLCVHVEIEPAHRTPTMQGERKTLTGKNQDQFMKRSYDTLINAAIILDERIIPFKERKHKNDERSSLPIKNIYTEKKLGQKRKAFTAYPATLKYLDENVKRNRKKNNR